MTVQDLMVANLTPSAAGAGVGGLRGPTSPPLVKSVRSGAAVLAA